MSTVNHDAVFSAYPNVVTYNVTNYKASEIDSLVVGSSLYLK